MRLLYFTTLPRYSLAIFGWQALITATNWTVSSSVKACTPLSLAALELNVGRERTRSWGATLIPPDQPQPHNVLGIMPLRTDMNTVIECIVYGCRLSFPAANRWNAGVHLRTAGTSRHPESKIPRPPGLRVLWIWELRRVCKPVCLFSNLHHASVTSTITFSFSPFSKKKNTPTPTHLPVFVLFLKQMSPMMSRL